jgi:hypothetical protein
VTDVLITRLDDGASLDFPDGVPVLSAIGVRVKE